jgi:hypothetical protein
MQKLRRPGFVLCLVLSVGPLAACAGNPVKDAAQAAGIGGEPKPAPDFVTRTRREGVGYMPIGESAPKRRLHAKDAAAVESAASSMDAARSKNEARGRAAKQAGEGAQAAAPAPAKPAQ